MRTLADWYPGDGFVFASLEVLGIITLLVVLTWAADRLLARRRAALGSTLWLSALMGVLLTPALVFLGGRLPWRHTLLSMEGINSAPSAERPIDALAKAPPSLASAPATSGPGEQSRMENRPALNPVVPFQGNAVSAPRRVETHDSAAAHPPVPGREPAAALPLEAPASSEPIASSLNVFRAFATLLLMVWMAGSIYLSTRLLHGWWRMRQLGRRLRPLHGECWEEELAAVARFLSVRRLPELYVSPDVHSPLVAGWLSPRVVLPERLLACSTPRQVRAILVHEYAHIVRRDPWASMVQRLAVAWFWPHPLVHLLSRRLDQTREETCDNHVLAYAEAPEYAEALLTAAQICYPIPRLEGYLTMMPRHHNLVRRVADLLEDRRDPATRLPLRQRVILVTSFALLLGAFSSFGLYGAANAQDEQAPAPSQQAPEDSGQPAKSPPQPAAVSVEGTILAADGSPAAGATVWAARLYHGPLDSRETIADARGHYTLSLNPGEWFVWARRGTQGGEGARQQPAARIVAGRTHRPVEIRLEERGVFHGRLLEAETGKPIVGGKLVVDAGLALVTDAEGRFTLGGLSRAGHEAFVVAPGRMRMRVLFDTTARADTELDVPVSRAGKIVGRVTDAAGNPIPGAYVGRHTSGTFFSISGLFTACDAQGRFEYDDAVPAGQPTRLTGGAPGYVDDEHNGIVPEDGKPLELQFRLQPKPDEREARPQATAGIPGEVRRAVSGTVRGPDNKPVSDVVVRWGYQDHTEAIQTRTNAEGVFRLIVPDRADMLAVLPRAFLPQFPPVAAGGDQKVDVVLQEGHTARGRVLDESGKPIKGVHVIAVTGSPDPRLANPFWLSESAGHTDAEGRFTMRGIPAGARFDFLKHGMSDIRNHNLDLDGADNKVAVTMSYGGAVFGRVVDPDGKPIRNFRVLVNFPREQRPGDQSGGYFAGFCGIGVRFTSADGTFVLTGVGADSVHRITALADGHGEATVDRVTAIALNRLTESKPVTLRATLPVRLRLRTFTTNGQPIAGARVTLVNGDPGLDRSFSWGYHDASWEDMARGRTAADGWLEFPALSFGAATLLVQAPGYARHRRGWRDGLRELGVELVPEAVVTGQVVNSAGAPVKECYVSLMSGGDQISASINPDSQGRFRIAELPAGEWKFTVRDTDGLTTLHMETLTLQVGETRKLEIKTKKE